MFISSPSPGVRALNGIEGNGQAILLRPEDESIAITADLDNKIISFRSIPMSTGLLLDNIPHLGCVPGQAVRMTSARIAVPALADTEANANVIGFIETITGAYATIRMSGVSSVAFMGLDVTKEYYLSSIVPGGVTTEVPLLPGTVILSLGQPLSDTEFVINKKTRIIRS